MNTNQFKFKMHLLKSNLSVFILALLFIGLTTSCLNDDPVPEPDPVGYVSLYHVAPIATSLSIQLDNNRINTNPFAYTDYTGYLRFFTGERNFKFTPSDASNTILEEDITVAEDNIYSLFVIGEVDSLELLVVNDQINFNGSQDSFIRILHASPDAPDVKLVFTDTVDAAFEDITYKEISDFEEIPSGVASFEIRDAETDDLISTVDDYRFERERFYTIVVRGYADSQAAEDKQLSVQVIRNFFNL